MSAWPTPITWANGGVTASQMNGLRDALNWLKGFAQNITASTDSDTGTATFLSITRPFATDGILRGIVSGEAQPRILVTAGRIVFGPGGSMAPPLYLDSDGVAPQLNLRSATPSATFGTRLFAWADQALGYANSFGIRNNANTTGMEFRMEGASNDPILFMQNTGGSIRATFNSSSQLIFDGSASSLQAKIGSSSASAAVDTNAFFAWVSGDSQPRASLGFDSSGRGRLSFGPGGATAPDTNLWRNAGAFESDSVFRVIRTATGLGAFAGRITGDSQDRMIVLADGTIRAGAGSSAPVQVLGNRVTGWAAATNTKSRTTFDTTTVTTAQLAQRVGALIDDLMTHGIIGT